MCSFPIKIHEKGSYMYSSTLGRYLDPLNHLLSKSFSLIFLYRHKYVCYTPYGTSVIRTHTRQYNLPNMSLSYQSQFSICRSIHSLFKTIVHSQQSFIQQFKIYVPTHSRTQASSSSPYTMIKITYNIVIRKYISVLQSDTSSQSVQTCFSPIIRLLF